MAAHMRPVKIYAPKGPEPSRGLLGGSNKVEKRLEQQLEDLEF